MATAHFFYLNNSRITTSIDVDFSTKSVFIKNYSTFPLELAFGINLNPSFEDFMFFIQSRCFPKNVDRLRLHLKELGLETYNPFLILKKTHGRLSHDHMSLESLEDFNYEN